MILASDETGDQDVSELANGVEKVEIGEATTEAGNEGEAATGQSASKKKRKRNKNKGLEAQSIYTEL